MGILDRSLTVLVASSCFASTAAFNTLKPGTCELFSRYHHSPTRHHHGLPFVGVTQPEVIHKRDRCSFGRSCLALSKGDATEDEEVEPLDEEPLAKGVDSVSWLPSVSEKQDTSIEKIEDAEVLPMFPLGGIVYTPNSNHVLNIFEPRYRQMYNDILMNGSKRFCVAMSHPTEKGKFAQIGVVFHLEDLREVSEQTADQIKYICDHRVTGRVKLHRIVNPEAWSSRETYLKVEGTLLADDPELDELVPDPEGEKDVYLAVAGASQSSKEEAALKRSFAALVNMQHELQEDVRFTQASVKTLGVKPGGGEESLWETIKLWQSYTEQRLAARQIELQKEFQTKLLKYLKEDKNMKEEEVPSQIGFSDLSPQLQKEVAELQKRMSIELQPLLLESTLTMQKILEAKDHAQRVNLVKFFVDAEYKRLEARKTLQGMFTAGGDWKDEGDEDDNEAEGSILMDEEDAFQ